MNHTKLSIIIPTKDRYKYLLPLLQLIDSYQLKNTEIVVEDNSADNSEYLKFTEAVKFATPVVYNHTPQQIAIALNVDNAVKHSSGEYLCMIGDDDAVTPLISDCLDWMEKNNVDSIRQKCELTYKWPTYSDNKGINLGATLTYEKITKDFVKVDLDKAVKGVVASGIMSLGRMPCLYQGIVKRKCLDSLYQIGGTYAPGPSPDMANAMALSFVVKSHYVIDMPVIVSGGSEYQGGRSKKIKSWVQPLENVPFISDEAKRKWDKRIPYFWCGHTVWPESGIKGLQYVGQEKYLENLDWDRLLARCMMRSFQRRNEILSRTLNKSKVRLLYAKLYCRQQLAQVKHLIWRKFDLKSKNTVKKTSVNDIRAAVDILVSEYK
jgi:glycosyltransferase involved in cell wall biosynthesis